MKNLIKRCVTMLLSLAMILTYMPMSMITAYAKVGGPPQHEKKITDNKDGTYTISLDVTGESERMPNKANVIVVFDTSSSMNSNSGTSTTTYTPTDSTSTGLYGLIDGEYVPLERRGTRWNRTFWYNGVQYTGQRYYRTDANQSRLQAAKAAINSLAESLLANNGGENPDDTIELALVDFANTGVIAQEPTTSLSDFQSTVNSRTAGNDDRGTNWEAGLQETLNVDFDDDDTTYVIFVSDGAPTFRNSSLGYNDYNSTYKVYGTGQEGTENITRAYTAATDDAKALVDAGYEFYTIFAYGNNAGATRMQDLTQASGAPSSNYYSAADTAALQAALNEILEKIETAGFGDVEIDDGTTNKVATSSGTFKLLEVDESSYKYWRAGGDYGTGNDGLGTEWNKTDDPAPPSAKLVDGVVEWDLSEVGTNGILENGVKYTVTFDVYPSQTTYDIIAQLKNGDLTYGDLSKYPKDVWDNIIDNGGGSYSINTNTTATLNYDDTRTPEQEDAVGYTNPPPVATAADSIPIEKKWKGEDADATSVPITVVMHDGDSTKNFHTETLNASNDWKGSAYVSVGILKNGQPLPGAEGHDFSFAELDPDQYRWEIDAPTVRPMLIDGGGEDHVPTMLIKEDADHQAPSGADTYTIDGAKYFADKAMAGLTATNYRRSSLNLTKVVTGEDAPKNAEFPFTLTVTNPRAPSTAPSAQDDPNHNSDYWVWLSIRDEKNQPVTGLNLGSGVSEDSGGYYYAPSGTTWSVNIKNGWSLRFTNLPTGSTYTFTEGTLPTGFLYNKSELTFEGKGTEDKSFKAGQTSTGTIQDTETVYKVAYTNDYQLTDLEITKAWADNNNQDGLRLTADELKAKLTLSPTVEGAEPEIKDNGDNTYTIKYKDLPRFKNGQEVEYTVAESAIDGYTTTGSPAKDHGTITNTHTPEETEVTVLKVWDDENNIGKIRPASINVQLKANGEDEGNPVALNEAGKWTYTWENLPKYKAGKEIEYTADETAVPAGYNKKVEKTTADDGTITFTVTNKYNPTPVSVDPPVQKIIENNPDLYNKGDFTFNIAAVTTGAPMPENTSITNSPDYELEDKEGYYEFGEIKFTTPGTYTYKVTESGKVDGVTNDQDAATGKILTFTVTDDGTGKLVVSPTTDQAQWTFTNTYNAEGEASITVTKEIAGAAWPAGKTLTLTIAGADGAPMPEETTASLTAAGSVTFGPIEYALSDAGKTYTYTISEDGFGAGWTGTPASITAKVEVTDKGDGTLETEVTYSPADAKFTNTYKATGTATLEATKAIKGAEWPENGKITFTLAGTASAPMPAAGGEKVTLTEEGKATFGEIAYTEADAGKTYTYTISEDGFGDGWTGSGDITATVKVTDNGDGTLKTEVTYDPEDDIITNTYAAEGEAVLEVKKEVEGAAWPEGKTLTFTLAGEGGTLPATKTATLSAEGKASFGAITYDESDVGKTYTYTITEDGFGKGWTGAPEKITATVKVTDNGDGTLKTEVTYDPEDDTITNTYKAKGEAVLEVTKKLAGAAWPDGKTITFTLAGEGGTLPATKTATLSAEGTASFGAITYDESDVGKTYTYTITEDGFGTGWTGAPEKITAKVVVTDNGDGTLKTDVTYDPEDKTITNTYKASGKAELKATKAITGAAWPKGKKLTLTATGSEGAPAPKNATVELTAAGEADFGEIAFTEADAGKTYTYTISEDGFGSGWTGSGDVTATVVVTDNGDGTLGTKVTYDPEDALITNTYAASGSATLSATKELTGRDWKDGETFDFTLYGPDGKEIETKQVSKGNETATFSAISYDQTDVGKTYTYTISETSELPGGMSKSGDITATVAVTDNGDGTLATSVTYTENATIINTYTASPTKAQIKVDKKITGYKPTADEVNGEFNMVLTPVEGAPMPEGKDTLETTVTTKNGEGSALFDEIEYTKAGTYKYEVTEKAGTHAGMTYDSNKYTVTVEVVDDLNGKLVATVKYAEESSESGEETQTSVEVTNDFQIKPIEVTLNVTKKIKDESDSAEDATFTFVLKDSEKNVVDEKSITTKDFTGNVDFDALKFEKDDTYTYYIQESIKEEDKKDGWTYDEEEYPVVIKISDDLTKAELVKDSVAYDGDETATTLEITNVYKAEPTTVSNITVNKTIEDTSGSAYETTFTFTLTGKDGAPMPENNKASVTGEGSVTFAEIKYEKAGTFKYTVKEEAADAKGYIYDTTEYDVTVTVTDEKGHLVAKVSYGEGESAEESTSIDIVNTYDPEDAKVKLKATKIVEDKTGSAPDEEFKFELVGPDGKVVETVTRKMGGPVEFSELTFDKVGTYNYTIREVAGSTPGYTYDTAEYNVTIAITDPDKDGVLKASVKGNNPEIENPYDVPPGEKSVTDDISVTKKLTGRDLKAGEFTFILEEVNGDRLLTATNDASGIVTFDPLTFDKVGDYTFTVREAKGNLENVTYDSKIYTVTAKVTDPHTGDNLEVEWVCDGGKKIVFENGYEEPPKPGEPNKPDTGDTNDLAGMLGLMGASAAGLLYMFFRRRREDYL